MIGIQERDFQRGHGNVVTLRLIGIFILRKITIFGTGNGIFQSDIVSLDISHPHLHECIFRHPLVTIHGLAVPAYYYMAILAEKGDTYHAIAFLVPHSELLPQKPTADDFQVYAVSIDKLEQETGIDFFCNLPDVIEDEVEKAYNKADWAW